MAITDPGSVKLSYLDMVQLEQSGAGLPAHAGKEAALYDGSGAQILGRTAVRHWLDPDPDAIAGTWEFSTYGNATQGELETAGWTFSDCTGSVANGMLKIVSTGSANVRAYLTVSLDGDFDYVTRISSLPSSPSAAYDYNCGLIVGIPGPTDVGHSVGQTFTGDGMTGYQKTPDTFDDQPADGATSVNAHMTSSGCLRLVRISGAVHCRVCRDMSFAFGLGSSTVNLGAWVGANSNDASTFTRLTYVFDATTSGQTFLIPFLRRYA